MAIRIELLGDDLSRGSSVWYRLAYVEGGSRLQVFEHYPVASGPTDADMVSSQETAWQIANRVVARSTGATPSPGLPDRARVRTGHDIGYSAGLMFALTYIDLLTPGRLVGDLRVAGSGGIGPDGVVSP